MDSDSDAPLEVSKATGKREFEEQRLLERQSQSAVKKKKTKRRKKADDDEVEAKLEPAPSKEHTLANELLATVANLKRRQEKLKKDQEKNKTKIKQQIIVGTRAKQTGFIPSSRNDNIQIAYYDNREGEYMYGEAPAESEDEESSDAEEKLNSEGPKHIKTVVNEYGDEHQSSAKAFLDIYLNGSRLNRVPYEKLQESRNHLRKPDPAYRS